MLVSACSCSSVSPVLVNQFHLLLLFFQFIPRFDKFMELLHVPFCFQCDWAQGNSVILVSIRLDQGMSRPLFVVFISCVVDALFSRDCYFAKLN
jgi:hypothetical protein